jgi:PAS domain S-box-containing protein
MPATLPAHEADPVLIFEDDELAPPAAASDSEQLPWRILIVDDDVDVHVVTKFALSNTSFLGRRLSFLHAYSGAEAVAILRDTPEIALVLLDVIMETNDAGLRVARQIREELDNKLVRIVLRTGQPGQALEHSIILDYDINDFWCKADLTTRKLFTTVISSLRVYATLLAAKHEHDALHARLTHASQVHAVVDQHALVLTLDPHGQIVDVNERLCALAGVARAELLGQALHALHPAPFPAQLASEITSALTRNGSWSGDVHTTFHAGPPVALRCAVRRFDGNDGAPCLYVAVANFLDPAS